MAAVERKYDLYGPTFRADPYATFAAMRADDPVFAQPGVDGETMIWFVTRHDDVAAVLLDDETFARDPRLALTPEQLALPGIHPEFGRVTLEQLLAAWVAHDLGHLVQVARTMARQYTGAAGPWVAYLTVLRR
jgi:cytochrome P450